MLHTFKLKQLNRKNQIHFAGNKSKLQELDCNQ